MSKYVPKQGDFVFHSFSDQEGYEQKGRRPALVVSNDLFNKHTKMVFACPVTNTNREFPFHIGIPTGVKVTGVVMVDQIKAIDFEARKVTFLAKAPDDLLNETLSMLGNILK